MERDVKLQPEEIDAKKKNEKRERNTIQRELLGKKLICLSAQLLRDDDNKKKRVSARISSIRSVQQPLK